MSLHSRPIPAPKTLGDLTSSPIRTHSAVAPEPHHAPQLSGSPPSESDLKAEPNRQPETRAEPAPVGGSSRPWYRREPWLAVMLAAFVPLAAAVLAPDPAQYPLIGLTGLALIVGAAMLIRQGVFGAHAASRKSRR